VEKAFRSKARIVEHLQSDPAAREPASSGEIPASGIRGSLEHIGLSSLLVMIEIERKSGILLLRSGDQTARVFLKKGRILAARFEGRAEPRGAEAIYELLRWTRGRFDFSSLEVEMEDEVGATTTHILLEGARRLDEDRR
jgi:hypothetical protein